MKVTSDNKQFILDRINKVILCFKDGYEITLNQIMNYDFDLDRFETSTIQITNTLTDKEMLHRFGKLENDADIITLVHIEGDIQTKNNIIMIDIPCNMYIRRLRTEGEFGRIGIMSVELEGWVK